MKKITFLSNSSIEFYKMYYSDSDRNEYIDITADRIPACIFNSLSRVCDDKVVLRLCLYLDMENKDVTYIDAKIYYWNGICACCRDYRLYNDGSYECKGNVSIL